MRLIRTLLIPILLISSFATTHAAVVGSSEVSCSNYGSDALSCNQCFDGGTDYVGDTTGKAFDDVFINNSTTNDYIIRRVGGLLAGPVALQSSVSVGLSSDYGISFPASIVWFTHESVDVAVLFFGTSTNIAKMSGGVLFTSVSAGANPNKPALRFEYITNVQKYDFDTKVTSGPIIEHKECAFVSPRWCGDGIVSNSETCDDGAQNGQPGKCNTSCTNVNITNPSCDSMTVSTASGSAPLDVNVTCNATDATNYLIDCGNGTVNLTSTAVCRYVTGGTYAPRCTINGNITSAACTKNVVVNPPPVAPACSTTITGTQTFPITAVTPGLCNVGNLTPLSFTTNVVGTQTNYTWTCTLAGMTSPTCNANYTPPQPNAPDLALKKFVNGNDAQTFLTAVNVSNNSNYEYTINVTNVGTGGLVASLTTVNDPLPAGVTLIGVPTGIGWTCSGASGSISFGCTRSDVLAPGASFPTITIPVRVTSSSTFLTNTAEVSNPNDVLTANNTDPAVIRIIPVPLPPECSSTISGALLAPITAGVCNSGTPINFTAVGTNPINYSWNCTNGIINTPACTATYTPSATAFDLSIKKFVNGLDAQNAGAAVTVGTSTGFTYTLQIKNEGPVASTGTTTVTDTLPAGVTLVSVPNVAPWTCNVAGNSFNCATTSSIASGATYPTITVNALTTTATGTITNIGNVANPNDTNALNNSDPAVIAVGVSATAFDLSIKKFVNGLDAQNAGAAVTVGTSTGFTYTLQIKNEGPVASTGTTTVTDTLPAGVTLVSVPNVAPWTCNVAGNSFNCATTSSIASGATYPTITVNALTTTATGTITNIGNVANPNDTNALNNSDPAVILAGGSSALCVPGATVGNQASPITAATAGLCQVGQAVGGFTGITVGNTTSYSWSCGGSAVGGACTATYTSGGSSGGASNVGKKCVNGVASCALYNTMAACIADGIPAALCYSADAVGQNMCQAQSLSCSGGGGGGGGGSCGDGVLGSSPGEECDVVGGASWCVSCKIVGLTNPGANPITDIWMTIPVLAGTQRIGYSWLDNTPGRVAFEENRMVLGVGTKAFTVADRVGFGIKTQYRIPLILPADKRICLKSDGSSLNSESICTTFGQAAAISNGITQWQRSDGKWFVNIGVGDYQVPNPSPRPPLPIAPALNDPNYAIKKAEYDMKLADYYNWTPYLPRSSTSANNITLFKGTTQYQGISKFVTLNNAFFGTNTGTDGKLAIVTDTTEIVAVPVRVSAAVVSSIGSSANRSLETFLNRTNPFAGFLVATSINTSTTSNNNTSTNTNVIIPVINGGVSGVVSNLGELEQYAVNGNKNVLAVNGNLTIDNCPGSTFVMNGVRTIIINGNLTIKCNIIYATNDATSSFAWIVKGGDIQVYNGTNSIPSVGAVTNLAGVYVSIKDNNVGGNITYAGNNTTQAILRIEGSMYGNANPLFNSRLYARATGAYDILTTGTILTYSNRALVNPPPLLSQYLGNYSVQRVVQ